MVQLQVGSAVIFRSRSPGQPMPGQTRHTGPDTEIGRGEGREGEDKELESLRGAARRGPLSPLSSSLALLGPVAAVPLVAVWNVDLSLQAAS